MIKQNKDFEYNLPLQAYREADGSVNILNYMPRKNSVVEMSLSEFNENDAKEKDLLYGVATNLLNLAVLFIEFAEGKRNAVYYHDEDIDKHLPPLTYTEIAEMIKTIVTLTESQNE